MTVQLTRNAPNRAEVEGRSGHLLIVSASSADIDPAIFMHQQAVSQKEPALFTGVCSPLDLRLPTSPVAVDGTERYTFYRTAQFQFWCSSAENMEEIWNTCISEVQDLINSLKIAESVITTTVTITAA